MFGEPFRESLPVMDDLTPTDLRELDARQGDGLDIRLLWDPATNDVVVTVEDSRTDDFLTFVVDPADARDAFHHPFAYAAAPPARTGPPVAY